MNPFIHIAAVVIGVGLFLLFFGEWGPRKRLSEICAMTPNPPPPRLKSILNKSYNKMSYYNSRERVEALEALSRSYNNVVSASKSKKIGTVTLLSAIEEEAKLIKNGQKSNLCDH